MKKIHLFTILILVSINFTFGQNTTIAKFKFEEAEESYLNEDYEITLENLNESENILGKTNPPILYLRIITLDKIINQSTFPNDLEIIELLKNNCSQYLKKYNKLDNNEDKYREVYKISESIKMYNFNEIEYNKALDNQLKIGKNLIKEAKIDAAIEFYIKAARQGNIKAMLELGYVYQFYKNDFENSMKWLELGSYNIDITPCLIRIGETYQRGLGITEINQKKAIEWFQKAAELNSFKAYEKLGNLYSEKNGEFENKKMAIETYNKVFQINPISKADSVDLRHIYSLLIDCEINNDEPDKNFSIALNLATKALSVFENFKSIPISDSFYVSKFNANIGEIYKLGGYGVDQDFDKAFYYLNKALYTNSSNNYSTSILVSDLNYEDQGQKDNLSLAISFLNPSIQNPTQNAEEIYSPIDYSASILLADLYYKGQGVEKNKKIAKSLINPVIRKLTLRANDLGNSKRKESALKLAEIYEIGIGIKVDAREANKWRSITVQQNMVESELKNRAIEDSKINYRGGSGAVWTAFASFLITPVFGIIPAVAIATTTPTERNLNFDKNNLKFDPIYKKAYVKQARKTKARSVLTGYLIGSATYLVLILALIS